MKFRDVLALGRKELKKQPDETLKEVDSILGHMGEADEARQSIHALERIRPGADIAFVRDYWPISDAASMDYLLDGLAKAGFD